MRGDNIMGGLSGGGQDLPSAGETLDHKVAGGKSKN